MHTHHLPLPTLDRERLEERDDIGRLTGVLYRFGVAAEEQAPRILVAIDGTAIGAALVQTLIDWRAQGWRFETHLLLVHDYLGKEAAERLLDEVGLADSEPVRAALGTAQMPHVLHVLMGNPAPRIQERADELGASMILMGTRGHGVLGSALLGSVAHKVVHTATRPVTLVRA